MAELSELLPVVFAAVQLSILLVVPVGQVVAAHRTPVGAGVGGYKTDSPGHVAETDK